MRRSKNEVPRDKKGRRLETEQMVVAEIIENQSKVLIGKKLTFLSPGTRRICGKLILVGRKKSVIQPDKGLPEEIENDKITIAI